MKTRRNFCKPNLFMVLLFRGYQVVRYSSLSVLTTVAKDHILKVWSPWRFSHSQRWIDDYSNHIKEHYTHECYSPSMLLLNLSATIPFITPTYLASLYVPLSSMYCLIDLYKTNFRTMHTPQDMHENCMLLKENVHVA